MNLPAERHSCGLTTPRLLHNRLPATVPAGGKREIHMFLQKVSNTNVFITRKYTKATKHNLNIYFTIILPTSVLFHDDSLPACFAACVAACAAGPLPE